MTPYYERGGITIYHADCRDVPRTLPESAIVTDPPYGTGGWRRTAPGMGADCRGSLIREDWDAGDTDWLEAASARVVFTFWPAGGALPLLAAAERVGLIKHRAIYMRKRDPKPMMDGRTRMSVEPIWVLSPDGFVMRGGDDVFDASTPRLGRDTDATGHPYEKPVEVMRWIIGKCDAPLILDPFMGSGATLRAAMDLGRMAIGIERDERWCEIAANRLAQEVLPMEIPA